MSKKFEALLPLRLKAIILVRVIVCTVTGTRFYVHFSWMDKRSVLEILRNAKEITSYVSVF